MPKMYLCMMARPCAGLSADQADRRVPESRCGSVRSRFFQWFRQVWSAIDRTPAII